MAQNWLYSRFNTFLERHMPEGLFPRALIILVAPVVLLQTIMTGLILERHFENVTRLLARSYARDVAMLVQLYEGSDKTEVSETRIEKLANDTLGLGLTITRGSLPEPLPQPFFSRADTRLTREFTVQMNRPFWLDISQQPDFVEVKVLAAPNTIFDFRTKGERTFATTG